MRQDHAVSTTGAFADFGPAASDLDRCAERRDDAAWLAAAWQSGQAVVVRLESEGVSVTDSAASIVDAPRAGESMPPVFLGMDAAEVAHFATLPHATTAMPPPASRSLRFILGEVPAAQARIAAYAMGLAQWHARNSFCACCGAHTRITQAGHTRRCESCGVDHHPRTDPAVIVLVTDEQDRALLGRQVKWPERRFSTLAGFVEPGESLEAAVAREVFEESAVRVANARYVASQPWPFPASLMLGYLADAANQTAVADGIELAEVLWFSRASLTERVDAGDVVLPPPTSISRRLINAWLDDSRVG